MLGAEQILDRVWKVSLMSLCFIMVQFSSCCAWKKFLDFLGQKETRLKVIHKIDECVVVYVPCL